MIMRGRSFCQARYATCVSWLAGPRLSLSTSSTSTPELATPPTLLTQPRSPRTRKTSPNACAHRPQRRGDVAGLDAARAGQQGRGNRGVGLVGRECPRLDPGQWRAGCRRTFYSLPSRRVRWPMPAGFPQILGVGLLERQVVVAGLFTA